MENFEVRNRRKGIEKEVPVAREEPRRVRKEQTVRIVCH